MQQCRTPAIAHNQFRRAFDGRQRENLTKDPKNLDGKSHRVHLDFQGTDSSKPPAVSLDDKAEEILEDAYQLIVLEITKGFNHWVGSCINHAWAKSLLQSDRVILVLNLLWNRSPAGQRGGGQGVGLDYLVDDLSKKSNEGNKEKGTARKGLDAKHEKGIPGSFNPVGLVGVAQFRALFLCLLIYGKCTEE